ncbi:single-stranded DNA-binding protein [bacterium]|nr:single-stranded DNA-binding protein [bacterium]
MQTLLDISQKLSKQVGKLTFSSPVTHVYNPLDYAWESYAQYLQKYARENVPYILLGMNPGPWGMAQNGVPFGEMDLVKNWLKINAAVGKPKDEHPKRPIEGFSCQRSEVSGKRLWGWAKERYKTPDKFFSRFFVVNYCPLVFMEASAKNRTPNQLPASEREALLELCDEALREQIRFLKPKAVIGVGQFAHQRAEASLKNTGISTFSICHPSPASPKANKGWAKIIEKEMSGFGIAF